MSVRTWGLRANLRAGTCWVGETEAQREAESCPRSPSQSQITPLVSAFQLRAHPKSSLSQPRGCCPPVFQRTRRLIAVPVGQMEPPQGLLNSLSKEDNEAQRGPAVPKVTQHEPQSSSLPAFPGTLRPARPSCILRCTAPHLGILAPGHRQGSGFYDSLYLRRSPHKSQDSRPAPLKQSHPEEWMYLGFQSWCTCAVTLDMPLGLSEPECPHSATQGCCGVLPGAACISTCVLFLASLWRKHLGQLGAWQGF